MASPFRRAAIGFAPCSVRQPVLDLPSETTRLRANRAGATANRWHATGAPPAPTLASSRAPDCDPGGPRSLPVPEQTQRRSGADAQYQKYIRATTRFTADCTSSAYAFAILFRSDVSFVAGDGMRRTGGGCPQARRIGRLTCKSRPGSYERDRKRKELSVYEVHDRTV